MQRFLINKIRNELVNHIESVNLVTDKVTKFDIEEKLKNVAEQDEIIYSLRDLLLKDSQPEIRWMAAYILGTLETVEAIPLLHYSTINDNNLHVRAISTLFVNFLETKNNLFRRNGSLRLLLLK